MSYFAPSYYTRFRCIADRCRHSCCVDWEICIDDETLSKYRRLPHILRTVTECDGEACFALRADGRCPHLNDSGLCNIILSHGEAYLSDICRRHPRFFNRVGGGRVEIGLGLVCEEACRLILSSEAPFSPVVLDGPEGNDCPDADPADEAPRDFDPSPVRDALLAAIGASGAGFYELLATLRAAYGIPVIHTPDEWIDRYLALELLDPAWADTLRAAKGAVAVGTEAFDPCFVRLLAYFVYRHVSVAEDPSDLRARLGFALLSVELLRYLHARQQNPTAEALADLSRRYSAEIEYSEDNTAELIFAFAAVL